jgi:valyl-tRNA synthetase
MLAGLADVVDTATAAMDAYDHTRALEVTETFFWTFCDDYLELVKDRAYGAGADADDTATASARAALAKALDTLLRLLAPVIPYATEEVWSWWKEGSVHRAPWPTADPLRDAAGDTDPAMLDAAGAALAALRKVKSEAKVSMRTRIVAGELAVPTATRHLVEQALADVLAAGRASVTLADGGAEVPSVRGPALEDA